MSIQFKSTQSNATVSIQPHLSSHGCLVVPMCCILCASKCEQLMTELCLTQVEVAVLVLVMVHQMAMVLVQVVMVLMDMEAVMVLVVMEVEVDMEV